MPQILSIEILKRACPQTRAILLNKYHPHLCAAMEEFEINTPLRVAAFVAQLLHESMGFVYFAEIASGAAYEHREDLGNTRPEAIRIAASNHSTPGRWWKGHGPIQITGYDNHKACGKYLGLDLLNDPALLEIPEHGFRGAGWFWHVFKKLNPLADVQDFTEITHRINGWENGMKDRLEYYHKLLREFGL